MVFSLFLSWAGNAILGLLRSGLLPLPSPFLVMMITRGGEGGLAGHRWLAGSLVWTIQTHTRWARRRRTATTTNNKTTSRDRLMKNESLQCILRGWRPLIEASPPPSLAGSQLPPPTVPSSTPRSHKVLTKRACPARWPGQSSSRPRAYAASAAAAAAQSVLCLPSCGCRYDAHNGKAGQQQTKKKRSCCALGGSSGPG